MDEPDAILINVARGEIIDERALYEHLKEHPNFMVAIDAWWIEPLRHGDSGSTTPSSSSELLGLAPQFRRWLPADYGGGHPVCAENVRRFLRGKPIAGLVRREDS